jgi:hypothetical protein
VIKQAKHNILHLEVVEIGDKRDSCQGRETPLIILNLRKTIGDIGREFQKLGEEKIMEREGRKRKKRKRNEKKIQPRGAIPFGQVSGRMRQTPCLSLVVTSPLNITASPLRTIISYS